MRCPTCHHSPCSCATANCCPDSSCEDPGLVDSGASIRVMDYRFCEHRLSNRQGILTCNVSSGGSFTIQWSDEPCLELPSLAVGVGDPISSLFTSLGDAHCWRRIVPNGQPGWLYSDGINFYLAPLPSDAGIPDPLEVSNLIVNELATINDLVIGNSLCFDALAEGDIASQIGLDENGCLKKGVPPSLSGALYYESSNYLEQPDNNDGPNSDKADGESAIIGNEIYDPNGLAHVLSETVIRIDKAGAYLIIWQGQFNGRSGTGYAVTLNFKLNNTVIATGCGRAVVAGQDTGININRNARVTGFHLVDLDVDDNLEIRVGKSSGGTSLLQEVKMVLIRLQASA